MKTVVIEKPVRDLQGLARTLKAHEPKLLLVNVGRDQHRTYVYLKDEEMQDPTPIVAEWVDPMELRLVPMNEAGVDGVPEARVGGDEAHVVLIEKIDSSTGQPMKGSEEILVRYHGAVNGLRRITLENGASSIQIGPTETPGDVVLHVSDMLSQLGHAEMVLRFMPVPPPVVVEEASAGTPTGEPSMTSEVLLSDVGQPIGAESAGDGDSAATKKKWWWQRIFSK